MVGVEAQSLMRLLLHRRILCGSGSGHPDYKARDCCRVQMCLTEVCWVTTNHLNS